MASLKWLTTIAVIATTSFFFEHAQSMGKTRHLFYLAVQHTHNRKYISSFRTDVPRNLQSLNATLIIPHEIRPDFWADIAVSVKTSKSPGFRKLFNFDVNVCDFLRSSNTNGPSIMQTWVSSLSRSGSVPLTCPIQKNNYTWFIFPTEKNRVHVLQIEGKYRFLAHLYLKVKSKGEHLLNISTIINIIFK